MSNKTSQIHVSNPTALGPTIKRNFSPKLNKLGPDSLQITISRLSLVVDLVGKMLFASLNRKGRLNIDESLTESELSMAF